MKNVMRNSFSYCIALILVLISHSEASTPIRACNNGHPLPLMVQINNCTSLPCDFVMNQGSNMVIQFVATKNSMNRLLADVKITTLGAQIPISLDESRSDICKNLLFGAYCPLDAGEDVTYHLIMNFNEKQPEVPVKLEVNIVDGNDGSVVSCFVTDGRIKKLF